MKKKHHPKEKKKGSLFERLGKIFKKKETAPRSHSHLEPAGFFKKIVLLKKKETKSKNPIRKETLASPKARSRLGERFRSLFGQKAEKITEAAKEQALIPKPDKHPVQGLKSLFKGKDLKSDSYKDIAKQIKILDASEKPEEEKPVEREAQAKENKPKATEKKADTQEPKKGFKEKLANLFAPKSRSNKKIALRPRRHQLRFYLEKAGLQVSPKKITHRIFDIAVVINLAISIFLIYNYSAYSGYSVTDIVLTFLLLWTIVFAAIIACFWIALYVYLDLKIFQRKVEIEDVLPDYLQLTASNIKAGMTIDRALWYAVRPRFGVLAYEIEVVAKETMKGIDLKVALERFSNKYDSAILKRSMSLLIEGIESGGEIGTLLNKISINIQETKIMKREMAANVTTYVIFISFATVAAAPALFALSGVLIKVISSLGSSVDETATSGFFISFSGSGIAYADFRIFAMVSLVVTSIFSSMIIATILKGSVKHGFKYIPMFVVSTLTIFLIADYFLGKLVSLVT